MDIDMNMDSDTTTTMEVPQAHPSEQQPHQAPIQTSEDLLTSQVADAPAAAPQLSSQTQDNFKDIAVKVHIRRPERDNWAYLGRAIVTRESVGPKSSRIVVRSVQSHKILTAFGEGTALQAEKRGNFVVVGCVEGNRVVSWSLNALNNSETLRLLAIIELCSLACKHFNGDPHLQNTYRRRIARAIKDDRRKRHKRRKDQDAMVAAFANTGLQDEEMPQ